MGLCGLFTVLVQDTFLIMATKLACVVLLGLIAVSTAFHFHCPHDGYFINDATSYIQCDNGLAKLRDCAPGSANPLDFGYGYYIASLHYPAAVCGVNLLG